MRQTIQPENIQVGDTIQIEYTSKGVLTTFTGTVTWRDRTTLMLGDGFHHSIKPRTAYYLARPA